MHIGSFRPVIFSDGDMQHNAIVVFRFDHHKCPLDYRSCGNRVLLEQKKIDTIVDELTKSKRGYLIRKT